MLENPRKGYRFLKFSFIYIAANLDNTHLRVLDIRERPWNYSIENPNNQTTASK